MGSVELHHSGLLVVGLGEALVDCFADHEHVGGAPLNLAAHAHALLSELNGRAVVASAVGTDELGQQILTELRGFGIDPSFLSVDPVHPTGRVDVAIDGLGQPLYRFQSDVAWDHLEWSENWHALATKCDAVSFGTLSQRTPASRNAITRFLETANQAIRLYDVNLRQDFYTREVVQRSFELASAVKLNVDELSIICQLLDIEGPSGIDPAIRMLMARYDLEWLALTQGPRGTILFTSDGRYEAAVPTYERHGGADSVGAGDACGAGLLVGALVGWPYERWVALANSMGSFVASRPGAIPKLPQRFIDSVAERDTSSSAEFAVFTPSADF